MSDGLEDADVAVETHGLLLSLAGLIDDELLGWCRELVAVGESEYALELVTASVQADRVRLPEQLHANLQDTAIRHRALGRADTLPSPDPSPRMRHKFSTDPTEHGFPAQPFGPSPEEALRLVPSRLLRDCKLWLTWRLTPAGGAPTPLPHPVVLVETSDVLGAEALAYQVAEVLSRAGVFASVEVFSNSLQLGDYHREALAAARSLPHGESREDGGLGESFGVSSSEGFTALEPPPLEPSPVKPVAVEPSSSPSPRPTPRARVEANGVGPRGGDEGSAPPRPKPSPGPEATNPRAPLRPVDRVITARDSARGRQPGTRQPGSSDDVAAGLHFEQGVVNGESVDHDGPPSVERPDTERPEQVWDQRPAPQKRDEPPAARGGQGQPPTSGTSPQKLPSPGPIQERPAGMRPSPGPAAKGAQQQGPGTQQQGPGTQQQGPGTQQQGPGTQQQGPGTQQQGPGVQQHGPGTQQQGPGAQQGPGTQQLGPGAPGPVAQPPTAPVKRPAPPHQAGSGMPPKRPSPRPQADTPDPDGLSDVEQRLLRQLQDELAAREDRTGGEPSETEQPQSRIFRSANGGRKRPPPGPQRNN
jgi:hypothetical protein